MLISRFGPVRTNFAIVVGMAAAIAASAACETPAKPEQESDPMELAPLKSRADLFETLGRQPNFMIGHGNDLPGAEKDYDFNQAGIYTLPAKLDIHYVYLSGVKDEPYYRGGGPGWPDYNPNGAFVTIIANNAAAHGAVPMFTLYQAAARGEEQFGAFREAEFMTHYWAGVRILFERLREFAKPALVHVEPDFWGFAQQRSPTDEPSDVPVVVGDVVPECQDLPGDVSGMGRCIIRLARQIAPKVSLGLHASGFGREGFPGRIGTYLKKCGASEADFIVVETLDRDAGCFEAASNPECQRKGGPPYWDLTNKSSPNPEQHLRWVKKIHDGTGLPVLWWQMPLGVPSDTPGGTAKRYRDNRVAYFFDHMPEFEAAGGFAAVFGVGAPNQTDITTDGGQFARAVVRYYQSPRRIAAE